MIEMSTFISAFGKVYPTIDDVAMLQDCDVTLRLLWCVLAVLQTYTMLQMMYMYMYLYTHMYLHYVHDIVHAHHVLNDVGLNGSSIIFDRTA